MTRITRMLIGAVGLCLTGAAAAADTTGAAQASNAVDDDRLICRKTLETGSLVRKKKECFTKREWDALAEAHRRGNQKLFDGLTERSSGQ
jgi:hypothetical protein